VILFNIGLIGVESKHAAFFGELINKRRLYEGYRISSVWGGDAAEKIPEIQKNFEIDYVCETYQEVIDRSDAVMVIQRRGSEHFMPAKIAIEAGKPVFADKPFTSNRAEADALADLAMKNNVPMMGGTTLKFLPQVMQTKQMAAKENTDTIMIRYYADANSLYDGFNFYGSHLAELCIWLCGEGYSEVKAVKNDNGVLASVLYAEIKAVINTSPEFYGLELILLGKTVRHFHIDEAECYKHGMDSFIRMLKSNTPPIDYSHYIASVRLTSEIIKSFENQ